LPSGASSGSSGGNSYDFVPALRSSQRLTAESSSGGVVPQRLEFGAVVGAPGGGVGNAHQDGGGADDVPGAAGADVASRDGGVGAPGSAGDGNSPRAGDGAPVEVVLTPEMIEEQNLLYACTYPNWTMPLRECPALSFVQAVCAGGHITLGAYTVRRPRVKEHAAVWAELLTYDAVVKLKRRNLLSKPLAREIGALMQHHDYVVPFNLIALTLAKGQEKDREAPPRAETDASVVLGLLFSTEGAVHHFKKWYESGGPDLRFERDLIQPMLTQYDLYLKDNPLLRGLVPGRSTYRKGTSATVETPLPKRRRREAVAYPDVSISDSEEDSDDEESGETELERPAPPQFADGVPLLRKAD